MGEILLEVKKQISDAINLKCYAEQEAILRRKVESLTESGVSGSIVVLGPRGSGKSTLVDHVIDDYKDNLRIIRLNGFLHNDEKLVINEISRQVDVKIDVDDENFSVSDSLQRILSSTGGKKGKNLIKSILFILDEFDRFTSSAHQNFLYNVLDKTTSSPLTDNENMSVFVIGISNRLDVVELLEKRVRSRLSQKQLFLFNGWTLEEYISFVQHFLELSIDSHLTKKLIKIWNDSVRACLKNTDVKRILKNQYFKNKSLQALKQLLMLVVSVTNPDTAVIEPECFSAAVETLHIPDDCILKSLSMLEICILLAATRFVDNAGDDENLNFEVIYQEYRKFTQKYARNLSFSKEVASKVNKIKSEYTNTVDRIYKIDVQAFENLLDYEFFVPINEHVNPNFVNEYKIVRLQFDTKFLIDFVQKIECSDVVKHWATDRLA